MAIVDATYYAHYNDGNGGDVVPCRVDDDLNAVVSFDKAESCRWYDGTAAMCDDEGVQFADGRDFAAIKYDEYEDAIAGGYADEYDLGKIVLFDADLLADAMSDFADAALAATMQGFDFSTCQPKGVPAIGFTADDAGLDVADAAEHVRRAIRSMEGNVARNRENNVRWPGFYDEYLSRCSPILDRMRELGDELEALAREIRNLG